MLSTKREASLLDTSSTLWQHIFQTVNYTMEVNWWEAQLPFPVCRKCANSQSLLTFLSVLRFKSEIVQGTSVGSTSIHKWASWQRIEQLNNTRYKKITICLGHSIKHLPRDGDQKFMHCCVRQRSSHCNLEESIPHVKLYLCEELGFAIPQCFGGLENW